MPLTVGTAGHIDHGKTWLVRALTGKDTDRLPEERERGISIDLGYAPLELPDGRRLSLIDVPGHERFVRNMVAGATGIDLFLLVIDAAEGARPQTHEHLAILRLLGIERGVIALTKCDVVDAETLELAIAEARELVPEAAVVATSAKTGAGLDELRAELARAAVEHRKQVLADRLRAELGVDDGADPDDRVILGRVDRGAEAREAPIGQDGRTAVGGVEREPLLDLGRARAVLAPHRLAVRVQEVDRGRDLVGTRRTDLSHPPSILSQTTTS